MQRIQATHARITIDQGKACLDVYAKDGELYIIEGIDLMEMRIKIMQADEFLAMSAHDVKPNMAHALLTENTRRE